MKNNKGHVLSRVEGFTLIEMLVVIAIVGLLSSVVLVALGPSRNKAKDARIVSNLNQMRAYIETTYNAVTGAYSATTNDTAITSLTGDITNNGQTALVYIGGGKYAVSSPLNVGGSYCVDSTGKTGNYAANQTNFDCR